MRTVLGQSLSRRTLAAPVTLSGVGIHTGAEATVTVRPATDGLRFSLPDGILLLPRAENVVDTARCTVLGTEGKRLSTVEHLLSACAGLGITDALIAVTGPELPIGDGSAAVWTQALQQVGLQEIASTTAVALTTLSEPVLVTGKGGAFVALYPSDVLRITVSVAFDHPLIGTQLARFDAATDDYSTAIAPARTFGFIEEVEALRAAGLAKGGSLDNAVIIYPDRYSSTLRFENELARHKLLDLMGDLLLANGETLPVADIIAVKPSHRLNTEAAKAVAMQWARQAEQENA